MQTFELKNANGLRMVVTDVGGAIMRLIVPIQNGIDIVAGLDAPQDYLKPHPFFGVAVGRFANRIGRGKFTLDGREYTLETNDGANHLHGGRASFALKTWKVEHVQDDKIVLVHFSPNGEGGYPSDLQVRMTYTLTPDNALRIEYEATTTSATVCNMTNHSYFNLEGHDAPNVYAHEMQIFSDEMTAVDAGLIPTGAFADVAGTPFDFRTPKTLGQDMEAAGKVHATGGYDHNYVLRENGLAAVVFSPKTGIKMTVSTDMPGMQLYTGNNLDGGVHGKGVSYGKHSGFCLETQFFPDTPNHPHFPSCVVRAGEVQKSFTEYKFSW
jgi:aldose 1-epimerase